MQPQVPEACAAFVGLAWADAQHDSCLPVAGSTRRECLRLAHRPDGIDASGCTLRPRFNGPPMAVCLERHKGPLVAALHNSDCLVLFPVHPLTVAQYREACTPSRAKDAPTAAALQGELLLNHRDQRTPLVPQSPTIRALAPLVAHRRRLGGAPVRLTHRLTSALTNSFPHILQWLQDKDTALLCDCLSRWLTLTAAPLARRATLERFFRAHHGRSPDVIPTRIEAIKTAVALTTEAGVSVPHPLRVHALVAHRRVTLQAIADCDPAMAQRAQAPPAFPVFDALPGAGAGLAPRLLGAFGEQRARFPSAEARQK